MPKYNISGYLKEQNNTVKSLTVKSNKRKTVIYNTFLKPNYIFKRSKNQIPINKPSIDKNYIKKTFKAFILSLSDYEKTLFLNYMDNLYIGELSRTFNTYEKLKKKLFFKNWVIEMIVNPDLITSESYKWSKKFLINLIKRFYIFINNL